MSLNNGDEKWDRRFLALAEHVAQWSKDPSTQTGAVIVDQNRRVVSVGYNGFPKGVQDDWQRLSDRPMKYAMIVHCERNALLFARGDVVGYTLYTWPFSSCMPCAAMVIQAGITRCVAPVCPPDKAERWGAELAQAIALFQEAGVHVDLLPPVKDNYRIIREGETSLDEVRRMASAAKPLIDIGVTCGCGKLPVHSTADPHPLNWAWEE